MDQKRPNESWQKAGIIAITIIVAFAMVWFNTYLRSRKYVNEGEAFLKDGKLMEAITSFETSAHAYTPINSNVVTSLNRLWEIGERFEQEKPQEPEYALVAFRSLRSSIYATRSFYTPHKYWIPRCDEKIQHLVEIQKANIEKARLSQEVLPAADPTPLQITP